jgi:adenosylcobinamide-GDP ribazoletransferase
MTDAGASDTSGASGGSGARGTWIDAVRLSVGTLSVLPTPPPRTVDTSTAGRALALAPLTGLVLGGLVAALALLAWEAGLAALPVAAVAVTVLALLCRAVHLDGLADTTDALGSAKPAEQALAIMARSEVGAFGALALVLAVVLQVSALTQLWADGRGAGALVVAVVASRGVLPLLCRRGIPAARPGGLGASVIGSVTPGLVATSLLLTFGVAVAAGWLTDGPGYPLQSAGAVLLAFVAAVLLAAHCIRRFGGMTGDVLGASVETALTVALLTLTL